MDDLARLTAGFRARRTDDGVVLTPPAGPGAGRVTIRRRLAPLCPVAEIVGSAVAQLPEGCETTRGPIRRLVTAEGENGALATLTVQRGAARNQMSLGVVLGDDFYSQVTGLAFVPELFDAFEELVALMTDRMSLGLGAARRRRCLFEPPAGWSGPSRDLVVELRPAGSPDEPGVLRVFPARPLALRPGHGSLDDLLEPMAAGPGVTVAWRTRRGLAGVLIEEAARIEACLCDARYLYRVQLESDERRLAAHRPLLHGLLESIEPVPVARPALLAGEPALHWAA